MRPDRWRIIVGATACVQTNTPRMFTEMTASKSASLIPPWTSPPCVFGLCLPAFARLEFVDIALGLEIEALDHRDEPVALLRWCRPDPATDDVVDAHARRAALARDDLALVMRGRPRELADRLGHHAAEGREHALRRVIPLHQAIASIPVAKRPMISFWICVVPS